MESANNTNSNRIKLSTSEVTTVEIYFAHEDPYCFDEDVTIYAEFGNLPAVRDVTWLRKTDTGSHTIDTTLPKFTSTNTMLMIEKCCESDIGTYFLVASTDVLDICSNRIQLNPLKVTVENTLYLFPIPSKLREHTLNWKLTYHE